GTSGAASGGGVGAIGAGGTEDPPPIGTSGSGIGMMINALELVRFSSPTWMGASGSVMVMTPDGEAPGSSTTPSPDQMISPHLTLPTLVFAPTSVRVISVFSGRPTS